MNYTEIMNKLKDLGTAQTKKIYQNHGADMDTFGVSMAELKKIAKKVKVNHELGLQFLNSHNTDAVYLSRWVVDSSQISIKELETILHETDYYLIIENVIPYIAGNNTSLAFECIEKWITKKHHTFRQAAYSIYTLMVMSLPNDELDINEVSLLVDYIRENIHNEQNRVRYTMNSFIIAVASSIPTLTTRAKEVANEIGKVHVSMGKTACKVPFAPTYIEKIERLGKIGVKRKIT